MDQKRILKATVYLLGAFGFALLAFWLFVRANDIVQFEKFDCMSFLGRSYNCPTGIWGWFKLKVLFQAFPALLSAIGALATLKMFVDSLLQRTEGSKVERKTILRIDQVRHSLKKIWIGFTVFVSENQKLCAIISLSFAALALVLPFSAFHWEASDKPVSGLEWLFLAPLSILMFVVTPSGLGALLSLSLGALLLSNLSYLILIVNCWSSKRRYSDYFFFMAVLASWYVKPLPGHFFWMMSLFLNFLIARTKSTGQSRTLSINSQ